MFRKVFEQLTYCDENDPTFCQGLIHCDPTVLPEVEPTLAIPILVLASWFYMPTPTLFLALVLVEFYVPTLL